VVAVEETPVVVSLSCYGWSKVSGESQQVVHEGGSPFRRLGRWVATLRWHGLIVRCHAIWNVRWNATRTTHTWMIRRHVEGIGRIRG
jgi:hypothetical protein